MRTKQSVMTASDVVELYRLFEHHNIHIWIDGGWAVDALLGKETRRHDDLDIAIYHKDVPRLRALLAARGYTEISRGDTWECNFVLDDKQGREIDVHSFELDKNGKNSFGVAYEAVHFGGEGMINGHKVRCINPKTLVMFHTGYPLDEDDHHDVVALCKHFGIELPEDHKHWRRRQKVLTAVHSLPLPEKRPLVIAISGYGGSGKSTLAAWLKQQLREAETIAADDFIMGRAKERSADWGSYDRPRLQKQVLEPALQGQPIRYQVYDWPNDKLGEWRNVPNSTYLIVEGLSILHPDLLQFYDLKIWVDCPLDIATKRGMQRDISVANNHDAMWLNIWMPNERDFMKKYRPDKAADITFNTN